MTARQMHQPRKDILRDQLVLAAETIIRLRTEIDQLRRPWWRRIPRKSA